MNLNGTCISCRPKCINLHKFCFFLVQFSRNNLSVKMPEHCRLDTGQILKVVSKALICDFITCWVKHFYSNVAQLRNDTTTTVANILFQFSCLYGSQLETRKCFHHMVLCNFFSFFVVVFCFRGGRAGGGGWVKYLVCPKLFSCSTHLYGEIFS